MSRTRVNTALVVAFAAAAVLALFAASATPAMAKQCVWNKAGFVLRVDWFKPGDFTANWNASNGFNEYAFAAQPIQTDQFWAASGRCIDRGPTEYVALLSMCGVDPNFTNNRVIQYPSDWTPDRRLNDCSIFAFTTPSTTRYLDVWGWMFDPQTGPGGPI